MNEYTLAQSYNLKLVSNKNGTTWILHYNKTGPPKPIGYIARSKKGHFYIKPFPQRKSLPPLNRS
jgi:hypothetical protein